MQVVRLFFKGFFRPLNFLLLISVSQITFALGSFEKSPASDFPLVYQLYQQAQIMEKQSIKGIRQANQLNKSLRKINSIRRKTPETLADLDQKVNLSDVFNQQISAWQAESGQLRERSQQLRLEAQQLMSRSFEREWDAWVNLQGALALTQNHGYPKAHNTEIRIVNTSLNTEAHRTKTASTPSSQADRSLKIPSQAGQNIPNTLDTMTNQVSRDLHFFARIEPIMEDLSQTPSIPLNHIHAWHLIVVDRQGNPVQGAAIDVTGHMPGHVHGLPTQPRVTQEKSPGVYQVGGLKFQMPGWWVMTFTLSDNSVKDSFTFNLHL